MVDPLELPASEITELLRLALRGAVAVHPAGERTWEQARSRDPCAFLIGGCTLTFFNDNGELDYVDNAIAPDGRHGDYDRWVDRGGGDPIDLLNDTERASLERLLDAARA